MENNQLDTYMVDVRNNMYKAKIIVISAITLVIISISVCAVIMSIGARNAATNIRIIDRQGNVYSSELIDPAKATDLQLRAFIINFVKLCYSFDANNIENNLNRALLLGDNSVAGYIQLHSKPNELYHAVKGLGRLASIDETQVLENITLGSNMSFKTSFIQKVVSGDSRTLYRVSISGTIVVVTPNGTDNPNGFLINNYVEVYEKL